MAFLIFQQSSWSFCAGTYLSPFWMQCACIEDNYADLLLEVLCVCTKDMKQKSFSEVSRKEYCICIAASRIGCRNQSAICKNVSCSRESMTESIDHAPAKLSPAKRRCFQMFDKPSHVGEKGDTCVNYEVPSAVVKWFGWRTVSMIGKNCIFSCTELVR